MSTLPLLLPDARLLSQDGRFGGLLATPVGVSPALPATEKKEKEKEKEKERKEEEDREKKKEKEKGGKEDYVSRSPRVKSSPCEISATAGEIYGWTAGGSPTAAIDSGACVPAYRATPALTDRERERERERESVVHRN